MTFGQDGVICSPLPPHWLGIAVRPKPLKEKGTKKVPWHWDEVHQRAFDHMKATIAKDVVLAYPDYSKIFEIYTDASSKQIGAVITQDNRPIAFFSWRLSNMQCKYSITKIKLLAIGKTLKGKLENIHASVPFNSVCQNISSLISGVTPELWQSKPFGARKDLCTPFFPISSQWSHLIAKNTSNYPKCQTLPPFNLWGHTEFVC